MNFIEVGKHYINLQNVVYTEKNNDNVIVHFVSGDCLCLVKDDVDNFLKAVQPHLEQHKPEYKMLFSWEQIEKLGA